MSNSADRDLRDTQTWRTRLQFTKSRAVAMLAATAIIVSALISTTAMSAAAEDPVPVDTSSSTIESTETQPIVEVTPSDEPAPAPTEPAPTEQATTEPAPTEDAPATEEPAEAETPQPSAAPTEDVVTEPTPSPEAAAPTETPAAEAKIASLADCTGNASDCGLLKVSVTVSGGPLAGSDFALTATSSAGTYDLVSGATKSVVRPATYTLDSTTTKTADLTNYTQAVSCSVGSTVSWSSSAPTTVNFGSGSANQDSRRTATCTYTYTYAGPATISVKVGGDRSTSGVTALSGTQLRLWAGSSSAPTTAFTTPWSLCTSDANGVCTFTVPDTNVDMIGGQDKTTGGNKGRQFWVVAETASSGWFLNTSLNSGSDGSFPSRQYAFRTPAMAASGTYSSTSDFMATNSSNSNYVYSSGTWAVSRNNPSFAPTCGIDLALVVDLSTSLRNNLQDVKNAANAVVDALQGTNSNIGVYTFGGTAPAPGMTNLNKTQVATTSGATTVKNSINAFTIGSASYTNWDAGLSQVPSGYKVAVIITDGNPTVYAGGTEADRTRFIEAEYGVFSANALKAKTTRVVALGVGDGINGSSLNLRALSGPTLGSDYFQAADFSAAQQVLRNLALGNCLGSISVTKQTVPNLNAANDTTGAVVAGAWKFTATSQTSGVGITGNATLTTPAGTGTVNYPITFGSNGSGKIRITEQQQSGFSVFTISSKYAVCTSKGLDGVSSPLTVTNVIDPANPGFEVTVPQSASVSCTMYNREPSAPTEIKVNKQWSVNGATPVDNSQNPLPGVSASLTLNGTGQAWGTPRDGFSKDQTVAINESTTIPSSLFLCKADGLQVKDSDGNVVSTTLPFNATIKQDAAKNIYTIVNKVKCDSELRLTKTVVGGTVGAASWTLSATGPAGSKAFASGTTGVTNSVTPAVTYDLTESAGSALYTLAGWSCVQVDSSNTAIGTPVSGASVKVALGTRMSCAATNKTGTLSLAKLVVNNNGGSATPSDFTLTATPATMTELAASSVVGSQAVAAANTFSVRPDHVYTLTEAAASGFTSYQNTELQQLVGGNWVTVNDSGQANVYPRKNATGQWEVKVTAGATAAYRFVNADAPAILKLKKIVTNDNGGKATATDWTLVATPTSGQTISMQTGGSSNAVANVVYTLSETGGPSGYDWTKLSCDGGHSDTTKANPKLTLGVGETVTCEFTNDDKQATLVLAKSVENNHGGKLDGAAWNNKLHAVNGATNLTFVNNGAKSVDAGTYVLSEDMIAGYAFKKLSCTGNSTPLSGTSITVKAGEVVTCTFTNEDIAPTLKFTKVVTNDNGGTAVASDWRLLATPTLGNLISMKTGGSSSAVAGVVYTLGEAGTSGYDWTKLVCDGGHTDTTLANPKLTLSPGEVVTCEFTNNDRPAMLVLAKSVENNHGGKLTSAAWNTKLHAKKGSTELTFNHNGSQTVDAGTYVLSEDAIAGYKFKSLSCTGNSVSVAGMAVTVQPGEKVTCTFTNEDIAPTLKLVKLLSINNNGGADVSEWTLAATAPGQPSVSVTSGTTTAVTANVSYTLKEVGGPRGYIHESLTCDSGKATSKSDPKLTLLPGEQVTCWFTNADTPSKLTLVKKVDNSTGGTQTADKWTLSATANGASVINGTGALQPDGSASISGTVKPGDAYLLNETGPSSYDASAWSCSVDRTGAELAVTGGAVTVPFGDDATCVITNTGNPSIGTGTKTVTSTKQNADGSWTIVYNIEVSNPSTKRTYTYDLVDTLRFGAGITVTNASWSGEGRSGTFTNGVATLATGQTVAKSGKHTYTVTVTATVGAEAVADETTACFVPGEETGGFLNTAKLTGEEQRGEELSACAEPIIPTVSKQPVSAVKNGDGTWTVQYRVTIAAPGQIPDGASVAYSLVESPELPASLQLVGDWKAAAEGSTPAPTTASWNGSGAWDVVKNAKLDEQHTSHSYLIDAVVKRSESVFEVAECDADSGIIVWNSVELHTSGLTFDDKACLPVNFKDVAIKKVSYLPEGQISVQPGDQFRYDLVVTNMGTERADNVRVIDSLPARLVIDDYAVTGDNAFTVDADNNTDTSVDMTLSGLRPGESVRITLKVTFQPQPTPAVGPEGSSTEPEVINDLVNTACVEMEGDEVESNNCDTVTTPARDIAVQVWTSCIGDAPILNWNVVKSESLKDLPISFVWAPDTNQAGTVPQQVTMEAPGGALTWSNRINWPGAAFTPSGVSIDYPGWRELKASDYTPDGAGFYIPGTTTVMTPAQQQQYVFNGLILDDSELDYSWRLGTHITFSVNPELTFAASYPAATPGCFVPRHTELKLEKTPSVTKTAPGKPIDYTITLKNISDDSAAAGVVLTDKIPASLKVTDITWTGKGDANAFPNWKDCEVTGSNAAGYGGTVTCELFGPLQPIGVDGASEAPALTIKTTVSPSAPAGDVVNVAVVDYNTFDDPSDTGRTSDDAKTTITGGAAGPGELAFTGTSGSLAITLLAIGALLAGLVLLRRRNHGEPDRLI